MAGESIARKSKRAITVSPRTLNPVESTTTIHEEVGEPGENKTKEKEVVETEATHTGSGKPNWEEIQDQVDDLNVRVARHFEDSNDADDWKIPMVKSPLQPTKEEWLQHQLTHTPYAPWCKHCFAARAVRADHKNAKLRARLVPDIDKSENGLVKISMDYMYMHDRVGGYKDDKWNPPYLVVVEHRFGRVWAYQTPNKGPHDQASWVLEKLIQDLDNCGFKEVRIQLKTDQGPAMISFQGAIQSLRPKEVIPVNSPVGESESNGRVENAIRRVQEKTTVLRHQLETNIKMKIFDSTPVMSWLVRWSAELLSKYTRGDDGKSPHERLHGERCTTPLVPFGE